MAYNMPNAWSPGFALPAYVEDEGLGRGAFVTKWLPRGTYGPAVLDYQAVPMAQVRSIARQGNAVSYGIASRGTRTMRPGQQGAARRYTGRALSGTSLPIVGELTVTKVAMLGGAVLLASMLLKKKRR